MRTPGYRTSNDEAVTVSDEDWGQNCYVIGKTGVGKTSWLESLMAQDLAQGRGFCFIDKHGDSAKRIADSAAQNIIYWRSADLSYPIWLNPLQNVPSDERWKVTANIVSVFSDIWGLGTETPRLLYYLRAAVRLLLDTNGTTLLDIRRLLSDDNFRTRCLRKCTDSETQQSWLEFNAKDERQQTQEIGSLQNKVAALADALPLRLVIDHRHPPHQRQRHRGYCRPLRHRRRTGAIARCAPGISIRIGGRSQVGYRGERAKGLHSLHRRVPGEARKWHLSIVLAHQFIAQISENGLHEAVLGNCAPSSHSVSGRRTRKCLPARSVRQKMS
jgi:hypothetical protein